MRLVIFDVDGTLVDSQADILASMAVAFTSAGLTVPSDEAVKGIVGLSLPVAMAQLAPLAEAATQEAMVVAYKANYNALRTANGEKGSPLYPGARAALERLRADPGVTLAVATGKSRRGLNGLFESHGLHDLFATSHVADDHPSKPDPAMVLACLRDTGIAAADAVIVGDTEFDIAMGQAAGIKAIGVRWGYHPDARLAAADVLIDSFDALDAALAEIWGQG